MCRYVYISMCWCVSIYIYIWGTPPHYVSVCIYIYIYRYILTAYTFWFKIFHLKFLNTQQWNIKDSKGKSYWSFFRRLSHSLINWFNTYIFTSAATIFFSWLTLHYLLVWLGLASFNPLSLFYVDLFLYIQIKYTWFINK